VNRRLLWLILGLVIYLVAIPFIFRNNGYWLTTFINASILGFISLGVWLTFSIGRINICQGAFALVGGLHTGDSLDALLTTLLVSCACGRSRCWIARVYHRLAYP
jgi:ribose/xylose/arabinose/galactoside ABC-type transport system permease subunit